jgi:hypothetical protein
LLIGEQYTTYFGVLAKIGLTPFKVDYHFLGIISGRYTRWAKQVCSGALSYTSTKSLGIPTKTMGYS